MKCPTALLKGFGALNFHNGGFVRKCRHEFVVDKNDGVVFHATFDYEICNTRGIGKGGDIASDLVEGQDEVLGQSTNKLHFGLVANNHDRGVTLNGNGRTFGSSKRRVGGIADSTARRFRDGRMDTTAETLVGGDNNE